MSRNQGITRYKLARRGDVRSLDSVQDNVLIAVSHWFVGAPILLVKNLTNESDQIIERAESSNNLILTAFFISPEEVCYKKPNANSGFDYFRFDVRTANKVLIRSTNNARKGQLPHYDGKILITDPSPALFDLARNTEDYPVVLPPEIPHDDFYSRGSVTLFDEAHYAVSGIKPGIVYVVECRSGNLVRSLEGEFDSLNPVFASRRYFVGVESDRKAVFVWSKDDGRRIEGPFSPGPNVDVSSAAISRNEQMIAIGDYSGHVRVLKIDDGSVVYKTTLARYRIEALNFSDDDGRLYIGTDTANLVVASLGSSS